MGRGLEKAAVARARGGLCSSSPTGKLRGSEHHAPGGLGSLPLKTRSDSCCSPRTWQGRDGWGCSGLLARAEGCNVGQGRGHSSRLPQPFVAPPRQHRRDPIPLSKGCKGEGAPTECFISSRCLKSNPWPGNPSPHLEMNPAWGARLPRVRLRWCRHYPCRNQSGSPAA